MGSVCAASLKGVGDAPIDLLSSSNLDANAILFINLSQSQQPNPHIRIISESSSLKLLKQDVNRIVHHVRCSTHCHALHRTLLMFASRFWLSDSVFLMLLPLMA